MATPPLVSIITPAYNVERFIDDAIVSVKNQTHSNWELIIINDGSIDKTELICKQHANNDERIKIITIANRGVSHARNIGLHEARGEYIAFLDADDFLASNYISDQVKAIQTSGADVAGAGVVSVDEFNAQPITKNSSDYYGRFLEPLVRYDPGVFLAVFYIAKKSSIEGILFEEKITNGEDFLFWLTCCAQRDLKYQGTHKDGYFYRIRANSASKNMAAWSRSQRFILRRAWSLNLGLNNKLKLSAKIFRQLASYYIKRTLGIKIDLQ